MDDLKTTYNRIAEDWHKDHVADMWWVEATEKFVSLLLAGAAVFDVGCGSGVKSKYLARKGFRVIGMDLSEKMIEIARREVPEASFSVGDMSALETLHEMFDGVFAQASLLHIPKASAAKVVLGFAKKLKPGGYVYIGVKELNPGGKEEEIRMENDYGYEYERFFSYYTSEEIKGYMADAGMEIVYENITPSGKTRWVQVIGRLRPEHLAFSIV